MTNYVTHMNKDDRTPRPFSDAELLLKKVQSDHAELRTLPDAEKMAGQTKSDCAYKYVQKAKHACALHEVGENSPKLAVAIAGLCEEVGGLIAKYSPDDRRVQECYRDAEEYYLLYAGSEGAAYAGAERVGKLLRGSVSPQLKRTGVSNPIYI